MVKTGNTPKICTFIIMLAMLLAIGGCIKVGPDYEKPETEMPKKWKQASDPALKRTEGDIRNWWTVFDDPMLTKFITQSSKGNLDLKAAVARIKESRARLGVARGDEYPQVTGQGDAYRQRVSDNTIGGGFGTYNNLQAGVEASWEIDLFGRIARSVEAAKADLQAAQEDRVDVLVSVYSQVAVTYLNVRSYQERIQAVQENIRSQQEVLKLTQARFKWGLATDLDVAQAQSILGSSEAEIPPLRSKLSTAINSMAVLLGKQPGYVDDLLVLPKPIPDVPAEVTVGVPADLLRQRPDIRKAERQLAAATARIGQATADLYPSFTLLGTLGLASSEASMFFNGGSGVFSIGPQFSWNIFQGGRIRQQIKVQDALTEQALVSYEQVVLNALNEAENAMQDFVQSKLRVQAWRRTVSASRRALKLAIRLYKEGLKDFQSVLDAQRSLFDADNALAYARGEAVINLVNIYTAMGGGWEPPAGNRQTAEASQAGAGQAK